MAVVATNLQAHGRQSQCRNFCSKYIAGGAWNKCSDSSGMTLLLQCFSSIREIFSKPNGTLRREFTTNVFHRLFCIQNQIFPLTCGACSEVVFEFE